MNNYPPRGLIVNLITPLNEEGQPDQQALTWLIRRIRNKVSAILAGSLRIGEAHSLKLDDRLAILNEALTGVGDSSPLFFEITGSSEAETIELLSRAETLLKKRNPDIDVYYLLTPLIYHSNRNLPDHLKDLGKGTNRPLILSNNPVLVRKFSSAIKHINIRTSVLKKISPNEQVVGLEFHGDISRALNYQRALKSRGNFRFYDGDESNFIAQPSSSGLISCGANLLPEAWMDVVNSSLDIYEGKRMYPDHLSHIWQDGQMVRRLYALYKPNPPVLLKKSLELMGLIPRARTASSEEKLSAQALAALEAELESFNLLN
ncbi:MAG: dihydrodipicolinate synthase family protein [Deltaproteobacteria bacterium]|nr:dihydrodipicolinate synthase family protein [Deltaproteobacteria bacterium]MBW2052137.1 dihydrodipicolinate synthase family protein [Deltaproteobacteria bacterium]MBW2140643.1 dihydrodipicolinate synthase family protein [Deltaproteobacteria bacterium]MBW2322450.1 dihydrodipicolinate synthase family protein [Deltaproteobacteria bacterium]